MNAHGMQTAQNNFINITIQNNASQKYPNQNFENLH